MAARTRARRWSPPGTRSGTRRSAWHACCPTNRSSSPSQSTTRTKCVTHCSQDSTLSQLFNRSAPLSAGPHAQPAFPGRRLSFPGRRLSYSSRRLSFPGRQRTHSQPNDPAAQDDLIGCFKIKFADIKEQDEHSVQPKWANLYGKSSALIQSLRERAPNWHTLPVLLPACVLVSQLARGLAVILLPRAFGRPRLSEQLAETVAALLQGPLWRRRERLRTR